MKALILLAVTIAATAAYGGDVGVTAQGGAGVSGGKAQVSFELRATGEVTNIVFSLPIPAPLTFSSTLSTAETPNCTTPSKGASGTITCTWATFPGNRISLPFEVAIPAAVADGSAIALSASATADADSDPSNNNATATLLVYGPADLSVRTDAPSTFVPGTIVDATFTVHNSGPSPVRALSLLISEERTAAGEFIAFSPPAGSTCHQTTDTEAVCTLGPLLPNQSVGVGTRFRTDSVEGQLRFLAQVSVTPDQDAANDFVIVNPAARYVSDLAVTVAAPPAATVGSTVPVAITISSSGPSAATSPALQYDLPPNSTFVSAAVSPFGKCTTPAVGAGGTVACTFSVLPPLGVDLFPEWQTVLVTIRPTTAGELTHTARATTAATDEHPANNSAAATTAVSAAAQGSADLSVAITPRATGVLKGSDVTLDVQVRNVGPDTAASAAVVMTIPLVADFVSASPSCAHGIDTVVCSVGALAAGQTATLSLMAHAREHVAVGSPSTSYAATVFSANDPNPANDSTTAAVDVTTPLNVTLFMSVSPQVANPQDVVTYTLTPGGVSSAGVTITDVLPAGTTLVEKPSQCSDGPTVVCTNVRAPIQLKVRAPSAAGPFTNRATVSCFCDSTPANNDATATARVAGAYDLGVAAAPLPASVQAGEPLEVHATVTNNGAAAVGGFFVNAQWLSSVNPAASPQYVPGLAAGASAPLVFQTFAPTSAAQTGIRVFLAVSGDTNPANDSATALTTLAAAGPADLAVSIAVAEEDARSQSLLLVRVSLRNNGPATASNAELRVPTGKFATSADGSCGGGSNGAFCTMLPIPPGATRSILITLDPPTTGPFVTTATVTSLNDPVAANNSASITLDRTLADLGVSLAGPATAAAGELVTFTVYLRNDGPTDAANLHLVYSGTPLAFVDEQLSGTPVNCSKPAAGAVGQEITCDATVYAAGGATKLALQYRVPSLLTAPVLSTVSVTDAKPDPLPANDSATVSTNVYAAPAVHRRATR